MKRCIPVIVCMLIITETISSQVYLKSEWIGRSSFRDEHNKKVGDSKGSAEVYQAGLNVPFAVNINEDERVTAWGIALTGSYTNLHNKNMSSRLAPEEILNGQLSLSHIRPLNKKWSLMAVAGIGVYTAHANLSHLSMKNVLGHGGAVAIYHWKYNLDLGVGLAMNNSFGYPMVFPAVALAWHVDGSWEVHIEMMNAVEMSVGVKLTDYFKMKLVVEMSGALALEKLDGKDQMFTHQYIVPGLQPEFLLGKGFSLPLTIGFVAERTAYYEERTLKAFFKGMKREYDPHFSIAPYLSVGVKYGF